MSVSCLDIGPLVSIHKAAECQDCNWYLEYSPGKGSRWRSPVERKAKEHTATTGHSVYVTDTRLRRISRA